MASNGGDERVFERQLTEAGPQIRQGDGRHVGPYQITAQTKGVVELLRHVVGPRQGNEATPVDRAPASPARLPDLAQDPHVSDKAVRLRRAHRHVERELQEKILVAQHERGHRLDPSGSRPLPDVVDRDAKGCRQPVG